MKKLLGSITLLVTALALTGCTLFSNSSGISQSPRGDRPLSDSSAPSVSPFSSDAPPTSGSTSASSPSPNSGYDGLQSHEGPQESRDDLIQEVLHQEWQFTQLSEYEIRIDYLSGIPACNGVRTAVTEEDHSIHIGVYTGRLPEAHHQTCTEQAVALFTIVTTEEPIADRAILSIN